MEPKKLNQADSRRVRNLLGKNLVEAAMIVAKKFPEEGKAILDQITEIAKSSVSKEEKDSALIGIVDQVVEFLTTNAKE